MTSYFDEHDCEPLGDSETPQQGNLLELARFLILTGNWRQEEFSSIFADRTPPPTSRSFIENLEKGKICDTDVCTDCPICLKQFQPQDEYLRLPCKHRFHSECVLPWLNKTSSCPLCRAELPTDDQDWEEMKRQKKREKDREADLEALHNSMFG
eukprot:TRINITY_DN6015_c0_g1_i6.p1 TRINITY_DN6015_c0_g1~~TRINITY_DN6015_c0_g1_i6.p1  ORF type:complete len:154 (-),score=21.55 TRINITY_DN6015_c0_g1_i6:391-852(-)